jgi:hypothetical protein
MSRLHAAPLCAFSAFAECSCLVATMARGHCRSTKASGDNVVDGREQMPLINTLCWAKNFGDSAGRKGCATSPEFPL